MPVMDGYTFLSIMKADPAYSSIPVIVTTQNDAESDEVAALSHGATDFVAKPYKPQIILHRVAGIIRLRETAAMINLMQYDRLTGLYSKEFFYEQVRNVLLRNPDTHYDIVCSDIENFKLINDVFGVKTGDRLLCGIGKAYEEKLGGRALLAARSIKGQYGKFFAIYDDTLRNQLLREQAITDSMETALARNQFLVYLQPKYRIRDENLIGAEALVRWIHPEWGFLSPAEFIPLFEKNGFITKLDQFVWDKACAAIRSWDDRGYYPISVSVNVSRADIYNEDLVSTLIQIVERYGLSPSRLHLEITESAYTENPKQIIDTVTLLREQGFVIEMDDFGSGYSSLNMLNDMPIDILKLDIKFIHNEMAKPKSQGILQFIINLARWMDLGVVAEGVETKEQLLRLSELGCDFVQGYYFARPMPCKDFEALLAAHKESGLQIPEEETCSGEELPVLLVADEDPVYRESVQQAFKGHYQVVGTATCDDTLEYIKNHRGIAAIVLSITLPDTDGFQVLKTIQRDKELWNLPIITTALSNPELENMALELGADDFICKPHLMQSLSKRIQRSVLFYASAGVALTQPGTRLQEQSKRRKPEASEKNTNKESCGLWKEETV